MSVDDFFVRESPFRTVAASVGRHVDSCVTEHVHPSDAWLVAIESRVTTAIGDCAGTADSADSGIPVCVWVD
jgi:hypothetical protein